MLLIVPKEGFVVKTNVKGQDTKAFINICTSEKVEKLRTKTAMRPDGQKGTQAGGCAEVQHQLSAYVHALHGSCCSHMCVRAHTHTHTHSAHTSTCLHMGPFTTMH